MILGNSYPFRSDDLIDKMIPKLLEGGSDTLIAAIKESRGIWLSDNEKINLINNPSMPRHLKKSHAYITLLGLCCVTHPSVLREKSLFKNNYSIYKVNDALSSIDINSIKKLNMIEKTLKKIKLN